MNTMSGAPNAKAENSPTSGLASPFPKKALFNGPCYLKMLVSNLVAGSIIGKNGAVISRIESNTNTSMKLSPTNQFFPGTNERVVVISGEQDSVHDAMNFVIEKINEVNSAQFGPDVGNDTRLTRGELIVKFAVPKSAVSGIIGKAGSQIKQLQEESKAKIQISSRELGLNERVVCITGTLENIQNAATQIATAIQDDANLKDHMYVTYNTPGGGGGGGGPQMPAGFASNGMAFDYQHLMGPNASYPFQAGAGGFTSGFAAGDLESVRFENCEISMEIPDSLIGFVIGKSGVYINDIMKTLGVTIKLAAKGDFIPGTQNRKVTINGPVDYVHRAHARLLLRMKEGTSSPGRNISGFAGQQFAGSPGMAAQTAQQHGSAYHNGMHYGYQSSPYATQYV